MWLVTPSGELLNLDQCIRVFSHRNPWLSEADSWYVEVTTFDGGRYTIAERVTKHQAQDMVANIRSFIEQHRPMLKLQS